MEVHLSIRRASVRVYYSFTLFGVLLYTWKTCWKQSLVYVLTQHSKRFVLNKLYLEDTILFLCKIDIFLQQMLKVWQEWGFSPQVNLPSEYGLAYRHCICLEYLTALEKFHFSWLCYRKCFFQGNSSTSKEKHDTLFFKNVHFLHRKLHGSPQPHLTPQDLDLSTVTMVHGVFVYFSNAGLSSLK